MNRYKFTECLFFKRILFSLFIFFTYSCEPVIHSFKVTTHDTVSVRKVTVDDTLKINWDIKGKPTLLVHETELPDSAGKLIEMKLVVQKGKRAVNQVVQVEVLPATSSTAITFTTRLFGDTLVAEGDKNPGVWGDRFEISSITNTSHRPLVITHVGETTFLDKDPTLSSFFAGTPVEGRWVFTSPVTPAEKANHSLLPERLEIKAVINYKRR